MTRKHYVMVAAAVADHRVFTEDHAILDLLAYRLAGDFAQDNPNFDTRRFLTACGVTS